MILIKKTFRELLILSLMLLPASAYAHTHLHASKPAQGDTVRTPLREINLEFSEPADARYMVVVLLDSSGQEVSLGVLHAVGGSPSKQYTLTLERPIVQGSFTVKWKAAGTDGHVTSGMFDFVVDVPDAIKDLRAPAATTLPMQMQGHPPEHMMHHVSETEIPPLYRPESSSAWMLARWLNFLGLMLMVGAVAFRFGVLERARKHFDDALVINVDEAIRGIAFVAAILAMLSNLMRAWLQSGALHGPDRMFQGELLSAMIFQTGWGKAWLAQTVAAIGFLIAALIRSENRLESWFSAAAFAVIAASTPAFSGHAAAVQQMAIVPIVDDAVHVISASAWLGSLAVLLFAALPIVIRAEDGFSRAAIFVHTFSPLALVMAGIAVFTGALNAFVHINSFAEFWTTTYGRILALKIIIVLITASLGAYNWRVVKPRLGTEAATRHIRRSAASELIMAAVVIFLTAVLVGTPTT